MTGFTCSKQHVKQLDALQEIAQALAQRLDQHKMFQDILLTLEKRLNVFHATIMLVSPNENELMVEALGSSGDTHRYDNQYRRGEGIIGNVLKTGKAEIIPSISDEPRFQNRIYRRGKEVNKKSSFICVPIVLGNETMGTLSVDFSKSSNLDLAEIERVLTITAGIIANDMHLRRIAKIEGEELEKENARLRNQLEERFKPKNMIGASDAMNEVFTKIHQVSGASTTVLVRGESGTGKELVASAIHFGNPESKSKPFVKVNCAALSENLLESELFGHEKGAFTGACKTRIGRLEEASGGTLFLDEIGDFSMGIQVKMLRILQEREFQRVGSNKTLKADVRIIAATNKDLEEAVRNGEFRQDLYYRINVFPIFIPPLRKRKSDILLLANKFVKRFASKMGKNIHRISTPSINMLTAYHWPGNVRELENCIEHAVLVSDDGVLHGRNLPPTLQFPDNSIESSPGNLKSRTAMLEKDMILDALKRSRGNIAAASRELGITGRMVRYKISNLKIDYNKIFKKMRGKS